jgi:hypothetical protein
MKVSERGSMDASLGISRRTLLRRGAVVGGLVWTAPIVHTLAAPAAAAGTPVEGISFVAILVQCNGEYYRMKWDVENNTLVGPQTGSGFSIPGGPDLLNGFSIEDGAAPGTVGSLVGDSVVINADPACVLVDYVIKHGPCNVGPGQPGQPGTGSTSPWTFSPLVSPPVC